MARGKPFPKGKSGNPGGRKALPAELRQFRETSLKDFLSNMQRYGGMTKTELKAELERPEATMFELISGNIVASAARGDKDARQLLIERLWGKVKEVMDTSVIDERLQAISKDKITQLLKEASNG